VVCIVTRRKPIDEHSELIPSLTQGSMIGKFISAFSHQQAGRLNWQLSVVMNEKRMTVSSSLFKSG
jgi:hypothetical protein